jgi:hypothetical protein
VATACQMIRSRIGEVAPVTAVVDVSTRRRDVLVLEHRPVISITSVQVLPGLAAVAAGDEGTGVDGWVLSAKDAAILRHTSRFPARVRVTYQAGRDPVPANVGLAAKELTAHLWRGPKLNAGGGRPSLSGDSATMVGSTFALPIRVRELLGLGRDVPYDQALIG